MVIQETLLAVVQDPLGFAKATVTLPLPRAELKVAEAGLNVVTLGAAPACVTASVRPAIVSDPALGAVELLAATE